MEREKTQKVSISSLWDAKVGKEKIQGRIFPSISGDRLFYINAEGELFAFEKKKWNKDMGKGNRRVKLQEE
ncbi:MAG: hypothetical protein Ct9H300mP3_06130 [Gammaproteobacteria bacterium]|nr:MAG: hypothetical protein Ct9H300mP3_06130 [Gammaproteobacteria bacterium]